MLGMAERSCGRRGCDIGILDGRVRLVAPETGEGVTGEMLHRAGIEVIRV